MRSAREMIRPMHDVTWRGEVSEEQRSSTAGVAAADHHDFLAAVEEAVAGRAGRDAKTLELFFGS